MKYSLLAILLLALTGCASTNIKQDQSMSEIYMKGEDAYAKGEYALAKQQYEKVLEKYPDNINAVFKLGNISMHEKEWDKAEQYYTFVLELKPRHEKAHHNLAMLHLHQARNHLNYYIAHNDSLDNKQMGKLIEAINDYSNQRTEQKTSLDKLADIVTK